jgi:hypothetical protein
MSPPVLGDVNLYRLLLLADLDLAAEARARSCPTCGGSLHSARYPRKPRGGAPAELSEEYSRRESLCCSVCRRRTTPPSVRFLGRRVYLGAVVLLVSAMTGGVTAKRATAMQRLVGVSIRTLQRWRAWWLRTLPRTLYWKEARARFLPPLDERMLPASLLGRFDGAGEGAGEGALQACLRCVRCLHFLAPITVSGGSDVEA